MTAILFCFLLVFVAPVSAFPDTDAAREQPVPLTEGVSRGDWRVGDHGLYLHAPDPLRGFQYWMGGSEVGDGMVRARVVLGSRPDFTLLLRASVPSAHPEQLSAIGVSVEKEKLVMYRWDEGKVRLMGAQVVIPQLQERESVELVAWLVGPHIMVVAYDPETLAQLGSVAIRDATQLTGHVGIRAHERQSHDTRLTELTWQDAGADPSPEPSPFGAFRVVTITSSQAARLPEDLREDIAVDDGDGIVIVRTSPDGLERIRRLGIDPRDVSAETPWWVLDERYRQHRTRPPVETERGFALDLSYKDAQMVEALLEGYHRKYPDITQLETLATSGQGRPILALRITDNPTVVEGEPAILINGAHHGNELLPVDYAFDSIAILLEGYGLDDVATRWVNELDIWVVPLVNPDGNYMFTHISIDGGRKNIRDTNGNGQIDPWDGVDLNRNYPFRWGTLAERGSSSLSYHGQYRGEDAATEVEVKAMMALADRIRPVGVLSWHTNATTILSPYTIDGAVNLEPDEAWGLAEAMSEAAGTQPNGRPFRVKRKLYSVDGVDQDWHRHAHGSAAYIVEGSHRTPLDPEVQAASIAGIRPIATTMLDRVLNGPRLSVRVTDRRGNPLEAEVRIVEVVRHEGERWTSRPSDGQFDLLLADAGNYTVQVLSEGFRPVEETVTVDGATTLEVVLR